MTVKELIEKLNLYVENQGDLDRTIAKGYCGDLLSWVIGRAGADSVWITIMSNVNVIAVALLADVSCILLAEDVRLDADAKARAEAQNITVLRSGEDAFTLAGKISRMI